MSKRTDQLLDQLLMLKMGNGGNSAAHLFLEDCGRYHPQDMQMAVSRSRSGRRGGVRCFIPPKNEDRVLMFEDGSGVYVHSDGLCTIMGTDIRGEVGAWVEEVH